MTKFNVTSENNLLRVIYVYEMKSVYIPPFDNIRDINVNMCYKTMHGHLIALLVLYSLHATRYVLHFLGSYKVSIF